jgi:hypothetical protein
MRPSIPAKAIEAATVRGGRAGAAPPRGTTRLTLTVTARFVGRYART